MSGNNNENISGCLLGTGIISIVILGFVLWGNIMDDVQNKGTTSPILSFGLLVLSVVGIIDFVMTKKRD